MSSEIVLLPYSASDLTIKFEKPSDSNLSLSHSKGIHNAWEKGTKIDPYGRIWICESELHNVLRTTRNNTRYFLLKISDQYKIERDGKTYIKGSEVGRLLDEIIQSANTLSREGYARYSSEVYQAIRDCAPVQLIRAKYYEKVKQLKRGLKQTRKRKLKLKHDELTNLDLKIYSEFSHIRSASLYLALADQYWNGLVVNKDTHKIITERNINNEDELLDLCNEYEWNTDWYSTFRICLDSYDLS